MNLPASLGRIVPGDLTSNPPLLALLCANLVTIVLAVVEGWDLASVLFIYWAQSVIIGIFAFISILSADTTMLAAEMGKAQAEAGGSPVVGEHFVSFYKVLLAGFFWLHYGLFHWGYYAFISESILFGPLNVADPGIWASCGLFFANHFYSYLYHRNSGPQGAMFVTRSFFEPYSRIVPMHLTIIFGSMIVLVLGFLGIPATLPVLVLFLVLKTRMDVVQHLRKHHEKLHPEDPAQLMVF